MQRAVYASLLMVVACSGGGGGCSSCSGVTPLPQGFPVNDRIENAATVRLTQPGVGFINDNLPALVNQFGTGLLMDGVLKQAIPPTNTKTKVLGVSVTVNVCENTPDPKHPKWCNVEADIGKSKLKLTPTAPNQLVLSGGLLARVAYVPIRAPTFLGDIKAHVTLSENDTCDENAAQFATIPLTLKLPIVADTNTKHGTRTGLSRVGKLALDLDINEDKIHICGDNFGGDILGFFAGFFKGTLVNQLTGPLQDQIDQALCIKGNPSVSPPCPVGSSPEDAKNPASKCVFDDDKNQCASFALGTEGTVNLGGALSSFSPTTTGGLDFLFSVGGLSANPNNNGLPLGDLNPANGGATLSLTGGANANPNAKCVNPAVLQKPTGIPTPKLLLNNDVPNWPAAFDKPHFGLAISEAFANHAMGGLYNSGLLCIQIGTEQVAQLNTGALSALLPSFKTLPLQKQNSPVGLVLRPSNPPTVVFGGGTDPKTDPSLKVDLKQLGIDFYAWSSDRYIRAFTTTFDLTVPVNLAVSKEGLAPQISELAVKGMKVTNSELLAEKPETIGSGIETLLSAAVGQALGGIQPIDLSNALASLGFTLNIPPSEAGKGSAGVQKLTEGTHNFLGIFASLGIAPTQSMQQTSTTQAEITDREVQPAGLRILTMTPENAPKLMVRAAASLGGRMEYSYRVDQGYWHPWEQAADLVVHDDVLRLQGKHTIHVKSRRVGEPHSEGEPVAVPVTMDVDPPQVQLRREGDRIAVRAVDQVADDEELRVRYSLDQGTFSAWEPYHDGVRIPVGDAAQVTVEVADTQENIATTSQALRGKVDTTGKTASGGCGCAIPGQSGGPGGVLGALGLASVLGGLSARRRRRLKEAAAGVLVLGVSGSWAGCSCSDNGAATEQTTPPNGGAGGEGGAAGSGGGTGGNSPTNPCKPENDCVTLNPGLIGSYTSVAAAKDGKIWVAGYNEADLDQGFPFGDLVVGVYDEAKGAVDWKTVDGTDPEEEVEPSTFNAEGWRGGKIEPGDDVGLWTSLALGDSDQPMVAYYDVTHGALKFTSFDGTAWTAHTVQQKNKAQIGRYAKMRLVGGKPVIAYFFYEQGQGGAASSGVRVARAKSALPASGSDWSFEDVFVNAQTPCRQSLCESGQKCNSTSGKCETPVMGCMGCTSDQGCFKGDQAPACQPLAGNKVEPYLNATGLYVSASLTKDKADIGIAFYDRLRGNLYVAQKKGAAWEAKIAEGQAGPAPGTDTGDVGIGSSLFIDDQGTWHLSYINGLDETLRYLAVPGGNAVDGATSEIVDFGGAPGANDFSAEKNIVGDDSSLSIRDGKIVIAYQNATTGKLRVATRPTAGGPWTRTEVKQDGKFAGFFSQQVTSNGKKRLVNFWRVGGAKVAGDVSLVDAP